MKSFGILSSGSEDNSYLKSFLTSILIEDVIINSYILQDNVSLNLDEKVILVSANYLSDTAKEKFPNAKIIIPKRIITGINFSEIMLIPKGTKVYVINDRESMALDTIQGLQEFGINHLELIPYWQGCKDIIPDISYSICPDYTYLSPPSVKTNIDIGRRVISYSSFAELVYSLGLDLENINRYNKFYCNLIINTNYKLVKQYHDTEAVKDTLEVILNFNSDPIVGIDASKNIVHFNYAAEKLFNISSNKAIGNTMEAIIGKYPVIMHLLEKDKDIENEVVFANNMNLVVSTETITNNNSYIKICRLNYIKRITDAAINIRKKSIEKGFFAKHTFDSIVFMGSAMKKTIEKSKIFAKTDLSIMLHGETGVGKELFAQSIHNASLRSDKPFVAVNFSALPENLVESELFGYEEGAFTGAKKGGKIGLFELAHEGTIFLDEIGDAPLNIQVRLLRVLEEREIMRIGSSKIIPIDVRIICATHKDLYEMTKIGKFREDLYFRLGAVPICIPSLRERKEDIPILIDSILKELGHSQDFDNFIIQRLKHYSWPGNVRQLRNTVQYFYVLWIEYKNNPLALEELINDYLKAEFGNNTKTDDLDDETLWVLKTIYALNESEGIASRSKILQVASKEFPSLTEGKLKTKLKYLERLELISSGKTKQGTSITFHGEKIVKKI